jgi:hypothetical protein
LTTRSTPPPYREKAPLTRLQLLANTSILSDEVLILPHEVFILLNKVRHWQTLACQTSEGNGIFDVNKLTDSIQIQDLLLEVRDLVVHVLLDVLHLRVQVDEGYTVE